LSARKRDANTRNRWLPPAAWSSGTKRAKAGEHLADPEVDRRERNRDERQQQRVLAVRGRPHDARQQRSGGEDERVLREPEQRDDGDAANRVRGFRRTPVDHAQSGAEAISARIFMIPPARQL
jgi:hypothetical protein